MDCAFFLNFNLVYKIQIHLYSTVFKTCNKQLLKKIGKFMGSYLVYKNLIKLRISVLVN